MALFQDAQGGTLQYEVLAGGVVRRLECGGRHGGGQAGAWRWIPKLAL